MRLGFKDLIDHARDWAGMPVGQGNSRLIYQAVQSAVRECEYARPWQFMRRYGRVSLDVPYSTGTIDYDDTGGAYERMVVLTGGTWPSWAADGVLEVDGKSYFVERRISDTVLTLVPDLKPDGDFSGKQYRLNHVIYQLPSDFAQGGTLYVDQSWFRMQVIRLDEWMQLYHLGGFRAGLPFFVAFGQDQRHPGRFAMFISPVALGGQKIDFMYQASLRQLRAAGEGPPDNVGTIDISGTTVTGTGTDFRPWHKGCLLRVGWNSNKPPTGWNGDNPPAEELEVLSVDSSTQLTLKSAPSQNYTGAAYLLTDPVDVPPSFQNLLYRAVERQMNQAFQLGKEPRQLDREFQRAFLQAAENDAAVWTRDWKEMNANWQPIILQP